MPREFTIVIEKGEDGYLVSEVVELPGCHTQARTLPELIKRTEEAIRAYLETEEPEIAGEFVGVQKIEV